MQVSRLIILGKGIFAIWIINYYLIYDQTWVRSWFKKKMKPGPNFGIQKVTPSRHANLGGDRRGQLPPPKQISAPSPRNLKVKF